MKAGAKRFDLKASLHGADCGCSAHRAPVVSVDSSPDRTRKLGWLASIAPVFACALCPACLSVWVPALASAGLAVTWTESDHHVLLAISVLAAIALSGWRAFRTRRALPLVLAVLGCGALVGAHLADESIVLTVLGAAILIASPWIERARLIAAR